MNKIKDIIYDKNDIFFAVLVLVIAGFVIFSRINVIMDYDSILEAQAAAGYKSAQPSESEGGKESDGFVSTSEEEEDLIEIEDVPVVPIETEDMTENEQAETVDQPAPPPQSGASVVVRVGTGQSSAEIAELLVDAKLIANKKIFFDAVKDAGAETKLKSGDFTIPLGSSPAQIVEILTT